MSRKAWILIWMLVTGLCATAAAVTASGDPAPTPGSPFSAVVTTESTTVFSDGNRILRSNTVRYFRDGQGRTRTERNFAITGEDVTAQARPRISINDPVSGERILLFPEHKLAFVIQQPATGAALAPKTADAADRSPPFGLMGIGMGIGAEPFTEASAATTSLGEKTVNGTLAQGTRWVRTIPSGAIGNEKPITSTREEWFSADLGLIVQITQQSTLGGRVTLNLTQLDRSEPDPSLFTVPAGYFVHHVPRPGVALQKNGSATGPVASAAATASP